MNAPGQVCQFCGRSLPTHRDGTLPVHLPITPEGRLGEGVCEGAGLLPRRLTAVRDGSHDEKSDD